MIDQTGFSHKELAGYLGMTEKSITNWLYREAIPTEKFKMLEEIISGSIPSKKISKISNVSSEDLIAELESRGWVFDNIRWK